MMNVKVTTVYQFSNALLGVINGQLSRTRFTPYMVYTAVNIYSFFLMNSEQVA